MEPTDDAWGVGRPALDLRRLIVVAGREENVLCSSRRSKSSIPCYETTSNY